MQLRERERVSEIERELSLRLLKFSNKPKKRWNIQKKKIVPTDSHNFSFFSLVAVKMRFFQRQRQLFSVLFSLSLYDFVVCRLRWNSSKYPTLPGFLMSSVYVDLAFQHTACFSFTFDVVMHRSALLYMVSCRCVRVCAPAVRADSSK